MLRLDLRSAGDLDFGEVRQDHLPRQCRSHPLPQRPVAAKGPARASQDRCQGAGALSKEDLRSSDRHRRGPRRSEGTPLPLLVGEGLKAARPVRPPLRLDLHLRRRRTRQRRRIRPCPTDGLHSDHEPLPGRVLQDLGPERSCRLGSRWRRMARQRQPGRARRHHPHAIAALFARLQLRRTNLAIPARAVPLAPAMARPRRHHPGMLRRMEWPGS